MANNAKPLVAGIAISLLTLAVVATSLPAPSASQASPYTMLSGSWRGSGTFSPLNESRERVVCRVSYKLSSGKLLQTLECAAADYRIAASGDFNIAGERLSGNWRESTFNLSGKASGSASGNRIYVRIDSSQFQARMSIRIPSPGAHTVDIEQFNPGTGRYSHMASLAFQR